MRRLILFAKRAEVGRVKTRLTPPLAPDQAVRLHQAFVDDGLEFIRRFRNEHCRVECCTDRLWETPAAPGIPMTLQCRGDLGARMLDAFRRTAGEGADATVILGADAPTLPHGFVEQAFRSLEEGADAVITPAEDGGYALVGACRPLPDLFRDVPWGGDGVTAATRAAAVEQSIVLEETEGWYDIDLPADLARLRRELATAEGGTRAPRTREALCAVWTPELGSC
jgi:rSAM/selenodomain-associated transferase 1